MLLPLSFLSVDFARLIIVLIRRSSKVGFRHRRRLLASKILA
jgi:hypothetical protein